MKLPEAKSAGVGVSKAIRSNCKNTEEASHGSVQTVSHLPLIVGLVGMSSETVGGECLTLFVWKTAYKLYKLYGLWFTILLIDIKILVDRDFYSLLI